MQQKDRASPKLFPWEPGGSERWLRGLSPTRSPRQASPEHLRVPSSSRRWPWSAPGTGPALLLCSLCLLLSFLQLKPMNPSDVSGTALATRAAGCPHPTSLGPRGEADKPQPACGQQAEGGGAGAPRSPCAGSLGVQDGSPETTGFVGINGVETQRPLGELTPATHQLWGHNPAQPVHLRPPAVRRVLLPVSPEG